MSKLQIFIEKGKCFYSKAIILAGKIQDGNAVASHCGFVVDGDYTIESLVMGGVSHRDWNVVKERDVELYNIDYKVMPIIWQAKAIKELNVLSDSFKGAYGLGKIPLLAGDAISTRLFKKPTFWFTKTFSVESFPICSGLVCRTLWNMIPGIEREDFKGWRYMHPDDLRDVLISRDYFTKKEVRV